MDRQGSQLQEYLSSEMGLWWQDRSFESTFYPLALSLSEMHRSPTPPPKPPFAAAVTAAVTLAESWVTASQVGGMREGSGAWRNPASQAQASAQMRLLIQEGPGQVPGVAWSVGSYADMRTPASGIFTEARVHPTACSLLHHVLFC